MHGSSVAEDRLWVIPMWFIPDMSLEPLTLLSMLTPYVEMEIRQVELMCDCFEIYSKMKRKRELCNRLRSASSEPQVLLASARVDWGPVEVWSTSWRVLRRVRACESFNGRG